VSETPLSPAALAAALERLELRPDTVRDVQGATQGQIELACARIATLTDLLRADPAWSETSRLTARLLLVELGTVSAQFRARATESADALTRAIDSIRTLLDRSAS
jgi:hypothetical protein